MKLIAAIVALLAATSMGMALDATPPDWLEEMQPGADYTYGEYATLRAVTEDGFTPQTLNSKLYFASGDVTADVDQTAATSINGIPEGVTRQLLAQSASAYVAKWPSLAIDAEVGDEKTTLIMNMQKDQTAMFSGKMVSDISETLDTGRDAPFDGLGANDKVSGTGYDYQGSDDYYGGDHMLAWLDLTGTPASWTATFNDEGSLTATDANKESVTLKQSLVDAKVTVSAEARDPNMPASSNVIEIIDSGCAGYGELWTLNPDGSNALIGPGHLVPSDYAGTAQLTEAAAAVSSDVTLTDKEVQLLGNTYDIRTMDGSFGLEGAFANAVLTEDSIINVDLDGDMDFSWT
jgi:hypothetical protein